MTLLKIVEALKKAKKAVAFTGAGVSVESGIPDFRGKDGIWVKYPIEEYATREAFLDHPKKFWTFYLELARSFSDVQPNPAHYGLARLEELGLLEGVITQNIDGLHRQAGSKNIAELHGTPDILDCLKCKTSITQKIASLTGAPHCSQCGEILKPRIVLFGDPLPVDQVQKAWELARTSDLFIVIGTSDLVYPASELPRMARQGGAVLCQFDIRSTGLTESGGVDYFMEGPAGESFSQLMDLIEP